MEQLLNLASKSRGDGATFQDSEQIQKPWSKFSSWRASLIFNSNFKVHGANIEAMEQLFKIVSKFRSHGASFQVGEKVLYSSSNFKVHGAKIEGMEQLFKIVSNSSSPRASFKER